MSLITTNGRLQQPNNLLPNQYPLIDDHVEKIRFQQALDYYEYISVYGIARRCKRNLGSSGIRITGINTKLSVPTMLLRHMGG